MIKICTLGLGNCGNQIVDSAMELYNIPGIAINSSSKDLENVKHVTKIVLGDSLGSGKNRDQAKEFIKLHVSELMKQEALINMIKEHNVIFIISSIGGGTGSGMSPILCDILTRTFKSKKFILVEVYPPISESLAAQQNSIEYLKEVRNNLKNITYMAYDNNKYANLTTPEMMKAINKEIVEMLLVFRGDYFYSTPYNSIDDKDLIGIISTPGRLAVYILDNMKEKDFDQQTIEDSVIDLIKNKSGNVELDRDKIVKKIGVITNLNENLNRLIDPNYKKIQDLVGIPVELFEHIYIGGMDENNRIILILSGLSVPDDRLTKIVQRIETGLSELASVKESSILDDTETNSKIKELRNGTIVTGEEELDFDSLFSKYDSF